MDQNRSAMGRFFSSWLKLGKMMNLLLMQNDWLFSLSSFLGGGALGGLISAVINRKENKRIKRSEAVQHEAAAKKEDASAATEMMGLLERTVAHMERMNDYNKTNAESLLQVVRERDQLNNRLEKDLELLQLPLLEQPELALVPEISARIMIEGMTRGLSNRGDFTGMALEDFFNDGRDDAVGARRVVNGLDRAHLVARYHAAFLRALRTSKMILFTLTALLLAGCKPGRVVTENRATETDSSAVWVLRNSLQWKDMEMARRRGGGRCCGR